MSYQELCIPILALNSVFQFRILYLSSSFETSINWKFEFRTGRGIQRSELEICVQNWEANTELWIGNLNSELGGEYRTLNWKFDFTAGTSWWRNDLLPLPLPPPPARPRPPKLPKNTYETSHIKIFNTKITSQTIISHPTHIGINLSFLVFIEVRMQ